MDGDGFADDTVWAIEPAQKAARLVLPRRDTLLLVHRWI